jgi:transcriptional regulator with XRE-family HTH domain
MTAPELKAIRVAIGWDKRSLALELGIAYRTMQDYEAGLRRIPEHIAVKMVELEDKDREWRRTLPARIDARIDAEFPQGIMSTEGGWE